MQLVCLDGAQLPQVKGVSLHQIQDQVYQGRQSYSCNKTFSNHSGHYWS